MKRILAAILVLTMALGLGAVPVLAAADVTYGFEETVLVDSGDVRVTVVEFEPDDNGRPTFSMLFENGSDKTLSFAIRDTYLDGRRCDCYGGLEDVPAGKKAYSDVYWREESLAKNGINYVNNVKAELRIRTDEDDPETLFDDMVDWSSNAVSDTPALADLAGGSGFTEVPVLSGDYTVVVKDFDPDGVWDDGQPSFTLYLENNTEKDVMFMAENVSVNGTMCDPYWQSIVAASTSLYDDSFFWSEDALEEAHIESFENVELEIVAMDFDTLDELARGQAVVDLTGTGTAAGTGEETAEEVTEEQTGPVPEEEAALAADEDAAAEQPAEAPAEEAAETPASAGEAPALAGRLDTDTLTYTNDVFGMSCTIAGGWSTYGQEEYASRNGWSEDSGQDPALYMDKFLADDGIASIFYAFSEDETQSINLAVNSFEGAGMMKGSTDAAIKNHIAIQMAGISGLEERGMFNCLALCDTVTIGGKAYQGIIYDYDRKDGETGELTRTHRETVYLVYNDDAADKCYVMTIMMTSDTDTIGDMGSFFTMPDAG